MTIAPFILLFLQVAWCTAEKNLVTKTVGIGEDVTLSCNIHTPKGVAALFWMRLVPGNMPEILGRTFSFDTNSVSIISHITIKVESDSLTLHFAQAKLSDTAFYYCLKSQQYNLTFLQGTFLRVKEPEPDFTAVIQHSPSDAVHPGDSVTLQCSVFSRREYKTCSGGHRVFWFRNTLEESHPRLIHGQSGSDGECDESPEAQTLQSCLYSFFKDNVSSSDAGAYYCAVAACGRIVFANGTKLDIEAVSTNESGKKDTLIFLLCAALAVSLIITALLICAIRKKSCNYSRASMSLETNTERVSNEQETQQRNRGPQVYSAVTFTRKEADRGGRRSATAKGETIYSDVKVY